MSEDVAANAQEHAKEAEGGETHGHVGGDAWNKKKLTFQHGFTRLFWNLSVSYNRIFDLKIYLSIFKIWIQFSEQKLALIILSLYIRVLNNGKWVLYFKRINI